MGVETRLSDLEPGQKAVVKAFSSREPAFVRLREMGVLVGTRVELVRVAPLGDPIEIAVRGTLLSLRRQEADTITVEQVS